MQDKHIKLIGISGSLRNASSASAILNHIGHLLPVQVDFTIYNDLKKIPAFDDSPQIPNVVSELIQLISGADGVFFCIPEYAFGVPGALKNALDWTVSTIAFSNKPVALVTAASGGEKAHQAFLLTLTALGSRIIEKNTMLISAVRTKLDEKGDIKDPQTLAGIHDLIHSFVQTIESYQEQIIGG
jgi:NAD(P)H-dependent FMN reductase